MSEGTLEQLDTWRQSVLSTWTDHRIADDLWVDVHLWFFLHLYADLVKYGMVVDGYSFREKVRDSLLTLKVHSDEGAYVVFSSSDTTTGCMRRLRERLREGDCKFVVDKYR